MSHKSVIYKYETGNPVQPNGSQDVRDGIDNLQSFDVFMNDESDTYNQRDGEVVQTLAGAVRSVGINRIGDFTTGCTVTARNQGVLEVGGSVYLWYGTLPKTVPPGSTPASTGGISPSAWVDVGDSSLRSDLASNETGNGVDLVYGAAKQVDVDVLQERTGVHAYIEDYASLVVGDDYTAAIQAALDTGKDIVGVKGKTYKTTSIINSQGQKFVGSLKLQLARTTIPAATVEVEYSQPSSENFRGIYVSSAYDLCEMIRIKSLGFNTVQHYLYFDNNGSIDINGTISKLAKNCATAGLNLVVNTDVPPSHGQGTATEIVAAADGFSNVIGYSVVDEPASRGISIATQDAMISTLRAVTKKKLYTVDFIWGLSSWQDYFSKNYDVFLVDSYSMYYASGDLASRINKDLGKMRTDFGGCMKMVGNARVIPVCQMYSEFKSSPVEGIHGSYCFDVDQIVGASTVFGQVGNGDYSAFIWDAGFTTTVSNEPKYQALAIKLSNHAGKGEVYRTEPIQFGGVASVYQRSLHDVIGIVGSSDPNNPTDVWLGGGAWPVRLKTGASETPNHTTSPGVDISGIGFRQTFSRLVTTKSMLKYFTGFAVFENYGTPLTVGASFNLYSTGDGGYSQTLKYTGEVTAGTPFRFSQPISSNFDGAGEDAVFEVLVGAPDVMANYRRFIYGLFVSTNW